MIVRVEEVVRLLGTRRAKILVVEFLDVRILMGQTERLVGVFEIEASHALVQQVAMTVQVGLSTAVDAAAGAGHDFDGLEAGTILADHFEHLAGVAKAGSDSDVEHSFLL